MAYRSKIQAMMFLLKIILGVMNISTIEQMP